MLSRGLFKVVDKVMDWYAHNCTTPPPMIDRSFQIDLPAGQSCTNIGIDVDDDANVNVC